MFKKLFAFLDDEPGPRVTREESENPRFTGDQVENDEQEEKVDPGARAFGFTIDEHDEESQRVAPQNSFLSMIKEKRRINDEKHQDYERERQEFAEAASEHRIEVKIEIETDFETFFKNAGQIVKQTRDMEEAQTLQRLGLEEEDTFDGKFSFRQVKHGKETMEEVSSIFRPRRQPTGTHFRQDGDDFEVCFSLCTGGREPPVNYDSLSESEFHRWQRHYIGLAKIFDRHLKHEDLNLDISGGWLGDVLSMKLLAEFIWRHPDMVNGVTATNAKGFKKKNCLMVMQALKECQGLKQLNFDHVKLCKEGSAALALVTKLSPNLETVSLINSSTMDPGACFWGLALASGCPNLQTLDISNGKIGANGATAIAIGLSKHQSLRVLNLSENRVNREGCQRLGEALLVNPILEELNLNDNAIGSRGAASLAAFLIHPNCKLKVLSLAGNDIGRRGGKALAVAMSINKSILKLDLGSNDISDIGVAGFGICLERNNCLRELVVSDCDITDLGASAFALGLKTNSSLTVLDMSNQIIGDAGCSEIAKFIAQNSTSSKLKKLILSSNAIRDNGAKALADMLKVNTSLSELKLNDNEIGNEGAIALGQVLAEKLNHNLKTLDVSENPIAAEVSIEWFTKAERRLVSQYTQRLDVVAQGTSLARGNLRGYGVIVMRNEMDGLYALISGTFALLGGWFDFASDITVARNTVVEALEHPEQSYVIYAVLTVLFVVLPFVYILVVFSLPADETDVTDSVIEKSVKKPRGHRGHDHHLAPQSSSLLLGRMTSNPSSAESFKEHLVKVSRAKCDESRVLLFFTNVFQMRIAYEIYLSYKEGITTLALSSIRLAEVIFEAIPQSIIQLHILLSTSNLQKIQRTGGIFSGDDNSVVLLIVSIAFSVSVLSNTVAGLFEEKFVVNWKRVALAHEELGYFLGFLASYVYHASHYLSRALTVTLIASIYSPLLTAVFFVVGGLLRLFLHWYTKSERMRTFAVISYLVGAASWDTRLASRLAVFCEALETVIVIAPLWVPIETIQAHIMNSPLVFQQNWLSLVEYVGPVFFTALLYSCWGLSFLIYIAFIERIHPYSDVPKTIDPLEAEILAKDPFDELTERQKQARREKLQINGKRLLRSMSSSVRASADSAKLLFVSPFQSAKGKRKHKANDMKLEPAQESEEEGEAAD